IQILMIQKTYSPPLLKKVGAVSTICQMNFLFLPDITAKAGANIRWFFKLKTLFQSFLNFFFHS
ncbi:hypothetical protein, partial [Maribacter sp.]